MADDKNRQDGFLQRWSERKRADRMVGSPEPVSVPAGAEDAGLPVAERPLRELTDADMPPLDSLDEQSDFSGFLSPRVSEALRHQALHKLFHLPSFNITDGLNDYDEDYTRANVLVEWASGKLVERQDRHNTLADRESVPTAATDSAAETSDPAGRAADAGALDGEDESNGNESEV